jgi:hypothetical protein
MGPESPPTRPFFSPWATPLRPSSPSPDCIWANPQGYAAAVLNVQQKLHVVSRFLSMCYEGRFCHCTTRCMIGAVLTEFLFICSIISTALSPDNLLMLRRFVAP